MSPFEVRTPATAPLRVKTLDENERSVRAVVAKMEAGFLRRFASLKDE
jgi:hypothetical protein